MITATSGSLENLSIDGTLTIASGGEIDAGGVTFDASGVTLPGGTSGSALLKFGSSLYSLSQFAGTISCSTHLNINGRLSVDDEVQFGGLLYAGFIGADTGTALVRNTAGYIKTDTSSLRYKQNVRPWHGR